MLFTKRHYEAIAAVLMNASMDVDREGGYVVAGIAKRLADLFEADNPRFNRDTFYVKSALVEPDAKVIPIVPVDPDSSDPWPTDRL